MIPPQIKRLFTSSPTFGLLLLFVTCIFLYALLPRSATSETLVSNADSTTGKLRYGYPPPTLTQAEPGVGSIDEPRPLDLQPLSTRYVSHFPGRTLPPVFDTPALRPLARKLHAFLHRRGFEHADFQAENDVACPRELSDRLVNADQVKGDGQFWDEMTSETIAEKRAGVVKWLEARVGLGEEVLGGVKSGEGRGIVLTGGNHVRAVYSSIFSFGRPCILPLGYSFLGKEAIGTGSWSGDIELRAVGIGGTAGEREEGEDRCMRGEPS